MFAEIIKEKLYPDSFTISELILNLTIVFQGTSDQALQ